MIAIPTPNWAVVRNNSASCSFLKGSIGRLIRFFLGGIDRACGVSVGIGEDKRELIKLSLFTPSTVLLKQTNDRAWIHGCGAPNSKLTKASIRNIFLNTY
jgi:hypothetical protein